jgi:hypothetical protein
MIAAGSSSSLTHMSLTRPKLQLDEQSFQSLLAAAFTIQQNAGLLKQVPDLAAKIPAPAQTTEARVCRHCASPLQDGESHCPKCGLEEFRPGERMQRKFASLWEMSREHGVHQDRPKKASQEAEVDLASSALVIIPEPDIAESKNDAGDAPERQEEESELAPPSEAVLSADSTAASSPVEEMLVEFPAAAVSSRVPLNFRQQLSLHRADLYLGAAVLLAVLALAWPAPTPPQRHRLDLWQRALVKIGIAEAPVPQTRYRGDPNIQVWVDPHTALYYCPGDELYGTTADGRQTSQRDAQADRFEPSNRAACN